MCMTRTQCVYGGHGIHMTCIEVTIEEHKCCKMLSSNHRTRTTLCLIDFFFRLTATPPCLTFGLFRDNRGLPFDDLVRFFDLPLLPTRSRLRANFRMCSSSFAICRRRCLALDVASDVRNGNEWSQATRVRIKILSQGMFVHPFFV